MILSNCIKELYEYIWSNNKIVTKNNIVNKLFNGWIIEN